MVEGYVPLAASMFVDDGRELVYLYSGSDSAITEV